MHTLQTTTLFLFGFLFYSCTSADCPLGSYSKNCSKLCHCRVGPCDGITGACGNGVCKDGWKGIACNETCPMESYSVNCSKQCHCLRGPCDGVSGECDKSGCKDGWTGIACNEKCGGVLTDPYGAITSPNYPWKYSRKNNCTWLINAPEGSRINVDFTDFELEKCKFCECDYLELFNGPTPSSPLVGKFCGTPNRFRSQSNSVRIVFTTDNTNIARGFRLTYTFSTQYDCAHGSYSVNCSKQCHCLVGPCDKVTGACENEVCEDGWKGKACNETKETTAAKPSTTDTISIPTTTTTIPTRNTASGTSPTTHVSIFTTERQHSHSEDSEKTHNPLFAATVTLSSVLGVVLVAVIICIVVFIRRRHRQSTGGTTANTESSPQQHYDDLLTSRDPGNYDYLQMPTCGQQGCTN
ncbi:hypothetical protein DPMN_104938 [Dreissena polymorpha]|uniref:CUB domain-containing protein n=3 Tax=Dreissena polymorpha TaxID=45954 RepID=A0A9D4HAN7_DREPO|nr:hypothetical protein DPMN_104938 [Dreissena polymorpha]